MKKEHNYKKEKKIITIQEIKITRKLTTIWKTEKPTNNNKDQYKKTGYMQHD